MTRVLLIAPPFFGYFRDIAEEFEKLGFAVDYVQDRPSNGVVFKSLGRISYGLVQKSIDSHFATLLSRLRERSYDLVFFVGGMSICFTRKQVEELRNASGAVFGLYLWDALGNCQRVRDYTDLFDFVFSFEPGDCDERTIRFLPLFYVDDYAQVPAVPEGGFDFDACFIGSVHQVSKFENVKRMVDVLEANGARVFCHYYMPSRLAALLRGATHRVYRGADLKFESLGRREIVQIYAHSRTVIDSPQGGQGGLTMRTMEALGAKRRLITANPAVKEYDFFRFGNVMVCEGGNMPDATFAASDPVEIPRNIYKRYSISSWLDRLLQAVE